MTTKLLSVLVDALMKTPPLRELRKRVGRLESRVALIVSDLDCDVAGGIASEVEELRREVQCLRACIAEFGSVPEGDVR